jgi:hypothetical protein
VIDILVDVHHHPPVNSCGTSAGALRLLRLRREDPKWKYVRVNSCRYLNNIIEQDHRAIKRRCAAMMGFKSFRNAPSRSPESSWRITFENGSSLSDLGPGIEAGHATARRNGYNWPSQPTGTPRTSSTSRETKRSWFNLPRRSH